MGGGNGVAVPRLSKRFIVGMSGMEPLQDQLRDVSVNIAASSENEKSPIAQHIFSPQTHCLQVSSNHVNLLSTNFLSANPRPLSAIPAGNIPEGIVLPITSFDAGKAKERRAAAGWQQEKQGFFYSQSDIANENSGLLTSTCLKLLKSSSTADIGTSRVNPMSILNNNYTEPASIFPKALFPVENDERMEDFIFPMISYVAPNTEGESTYVPKNGETKILAQSHASLKQRSDEDSYGAAEPHSKVTFPSREAKARTCIRNRLRRARISEGIKALQYSVPCSDKVPLLEKSTRLSKRGMGLNEVTDSKESVLDDVIDYIKYLKLQLKALSHSRLCGEATSYPFVHLEGYGHYFLHQQMCKEPLEEMMGQLIEMDPLAANELLDSKGLTVFPMALAYTLLQTT